MPVQATRFRLQVDRLRGVQALDRALEALSASLPFAHVTQLLLDHRRFRIATERFPVAIWQQLLARRAWHPKLVSHWVESLAAPDPVRRQALQARFIGLLQKPHARVALAGTLWYEDESTPGLLAEVIFPRMRALGCRLHVEAFRAQRTARDEEALRVWRLQRHLYREAAVP